MDQQPAKKCEFCGMVATQSYADDHGVTHWACEHHQPSPAEPAGNVQRPQGHDRTGAHPAHAGHAVNVFRDKFWVSLVVTLPTVLFSPMFQKLVHIHVAFRGSAWIPLVGGTFLFVYGGSVFLKGAANELRAKLPGMMTLISLAIIAAFGWSVAASIFGLGGDFFWELATLITIMLLGHWIEMKSVSDASSSLSELAKLLPDMAERVTDAATVVTETVPLNALVTGDSVLVRPGSKVPVDGTVVDGASALNESMITGESKPVEKTIGSPVIAGTINGNGVLKIKVTRVGADTVLSGIMRLVAEAQASRSRTQVVTDKAAFVLTVIAIVVGGVTFASWLFVGAGLTFAFERLVTVLIITCPHALGLAVPLVTSISTSLAARSGILVRKRVALEAARQVDVVLFDKTGTLTTGNFGVVDVVGAAGYSSSDALSLAAAIGKTSQHPINTAITSAAQARHVSPVSVQAVATIPGRGVRGTHKGQTVMLGGPQLLVLERLAVPDALRGAATAADRAGQTIVYLIVGGRVCGAITLADRVRPESKVAAAALKQLGLTPAILTGDATAVAHGVAKELGIELVFAQVLPEDKVNKVKELQAKGTHVMMVGDGVNDAAALAQADVGVAIGAGTDVAIESAGIILMRNDPRDILRIITLARATYTKTVQNLVWATGYNVLAIPLAAGVLAGHGILLAPAVGAILMSLSTVIVAVNAQFLRRLRL